MATNNRLSSLHDAIEAVCPIDGISVGRFHDKTTWRVDFGASATAAQKKAAKAVVAAFDATAPIAPPTPDQLYDQVLQAHPLLKALILALNDGSFVVGGNKSGAQVKATLKAKM